MSDLFSACCFSEILMQNILSVTIIMCRTTVYRSLEDFVTWTDTSAIRKHVMEYNEMVGAMKHNFIQSRFYYISGFSCHLGCQYCMTDDLPTPCRPVHLLSPVLSMPYWHSS